MLFYYHCFITRCFKIIIVLLAGICWHSLCHTLTLVFIRLFFYKQSLDPVNVLTDMSTLLKCLVIIHRKLLVKMSRDWTLMSWDWTLMRFREIKIFLHFPMFILPAISVMWTLMGGWVILWTLRAKLEILIFWKVKLFLALEIETSTSFQQKQKSNIFQSNIFFCKTLAQL